VINKGGGDWLSTLGGLGMFGAGVALVGFGKWLGRNDVAWLSNVIRTALGAPVVGQASELSAPTPSAAHSVSSLPTVLRVTVLVLLVVGAMEFWSTISGISSWHSSPGHTVITRFSSWPLRLGTGVYGLCTLGLALGVYRRKQWAWRLGFAFFGVAGLTSIVQAFTSALFPDSAVVRAIFSMLLLAVTLYWGWWWYAQRIHFSVRAANFVVPP